MALQNSLLCYIIVKHHGIEIFIDRQTPVVVQKTKCDRLYADSINLPAEN